ncbi:hypothetical protein Vretimale_9558 [Volvox reticuliferus]|nr:hypothetical protein Vretifemale_18781 [Volvox reticuliferus]GIM05076.1 hypothetical protein Vretimale_9558 [Volvox reticuliferus]
MSGINHLPTPLKQQDEGDKPPRQPMLNSAVDAGNASVSSDVGGHLASPGLAKFSPPTTNLHPTGVECYPTSDEGRPVAGAAAAERRALAQLYPSVARLHYSRAPGANIGHRTLGDVGTPLSSNADGVCVKSDVGDPEVIGVAGWLGSTRRGVLKRSRSWDGRTGSSPPCIATEAPKGGVQIPRSQYVQSKPAETCMQRQRTRWADGQLLYTAAASALPVDCSFRSLRNATTAAIVAAAATANGPSTNGTGTARSAPQAYLSAPSRTVAASVSGQAAVVIAGEDNMAKVATCAALSRPSHATAASAAGVGDNHPDAARLRSTQDMYGGVALTDADAGGVADATSLLDDPRNYETPELLAQLLYDSAPVVPGPIDATEFRVGNGRPAAPEQPPGNGMLQGSWARVAGEGGDLGGGLTAVDNDGPGGLRVSREQRLARLRALREEVTATERLLGTLRRMVAAEEKALASTTAGDDSSGGCASGVAPSRQASTVLQAHAHAGAHLHVQSHRHGTGLCSEQGDGLGV